MGREVEPLRGRRPRGPGSPRSPRPPPVPRRAGERPSRRRGHRPCDASPTRSGPVRAAPKAAPKLPLPARARPGMPTRSDRRRWRWARERRAAGERRSPVTTSASSELTHRMRSTLLPSTPYLTRLRARSPRLFPCGLCTCQKTAVAFAAGAERARDVEGGEMAVEDGRLVALAQQRGDQARHVRPGDRGGEAERNAVLTQLLEPTTVSRDGTEDGLAAPSAQLPARMTARAASV